MSRFATIILVLFGMLVICSGCVSSPEKSNVVPSLSATPAPDSSLRTAATPTICPSIWDNSSFWILINPVANHVKGEAFVITGMTSLPPGTILSVSVVQTQPSANERRPETYTDVRGSAMVSQGNCTANTWAFSKNLTTLMPFSYSVYVTAKNETIESNYAEFAILDNQTYNY